MSAKSTDRPLALHTTMIPRSKTIRISASTFRRLKAWSTLCGATIQTLADDAIELMLNEAEAQHPILKRFAKERPADEDAGTATKPGRN